MSNAATWLSIGSRGILASILAAFLLPVMAQVELHEIHGINHRIYESMFFEQYKRRTFAMNKDRLDAVWDQGNPALLGQRE